MKAIATKLLTEGYNIRSGRELAGYKDVRRTMIYTHLLNCAPEKASAVQPTFCHTGPMSASEKLSNALEEG